MADILAYCAKFTPGKRVSIHSALKVRSGNVGPIGNVAKQTCSRQESNPGRWYTRRQCYLCATPICMAVLKSAAIIFQLKCLLTLIYLYAVALHPMAHVQDKTAMPTTKHTVPVHYSKHITGNIWPATGFVVNFLPKRFHVTQPFLTPWH